MWTIYEKKQLAKQLVKAPEEVLVRYEVWKKIVENQGPSGLREIKGFHDEKLLGQWLGFRSSRLGIKWRVIYKSELNVCEVYVVEITPHDY